jgi:hypothetical protein
MDSWIQNHSSRTFQCAAHSRIQDPDPKNVLELSGCGSVVNIPQPRSNLKHKKYSVAIETRSRVRFLIHFNRNPFWDIPGHSAANLANPEAFPNIAKLHSANICIQKHTLDYSLVKNIVLITSRIRHSIRCIGMVHLAIFYTELRHFRLHQLLQLLGDGSIRRRKL